MSVKNYFIKFMKEIIFFLVIFIIFVPIIFVWVPNYVIDRFDLSQDSQIIISAIAMTVFVVISLTIIFIIQIKNRSRDD